MNASNLDLERLSSNLTSSKTKVRVEALNELSQRYRNFLFSNDYPENYSTFLNMIPEFLRLTICNITSKDVKQRNAAVQTTKSMFSWICAKQDHFKLSKFVNLVIKFGFSSECTTDAKSFLAMSLPLIITDINENSKFENFSPHDLASDFEPLLRVLVYSANSAQKNQSSFKQAFLSIIKFIGNRAFNLIIRYWKRPSLNSQLSTSEYTLMQSWIENLHLFDFFDKDDTPLSDYEEFDDSIPIDDSVSSADSDQDMLEPIKSPNSDQDSLTSLSSNQSPLTNSLKLNSLLFLMPQSIINDLILGANSDHSVQETFDSSRNRHLALEALKKTILNAFQDCDMRRQLLYGENTGPSDPPHNTMAFTSLITILNDLIDDPNFNIILSALEITALLVESIITERIKFYKEMNYSNNIRMRQQHKHLDAQTTKSICQRLTKMLFGGLNDAKLVVRAATSKLLMTIARLPNGPMTLVKNVAIVLLKDGKTGAMETGVTTRLRQEAVDLTTSLLLTFPSSEFDLNVIFQQIVTPGLSDRKMAVRLSTLECVAVLNNILGSQNLGVLMQAVQAADQILMQASSLNSSSEYGDSKLKKPLNSYGLDQAGVIMVTVQARLSRRQLPHLDSQSRVVPGVVAVVTDHNSNEGLLSSRRFGSRTKLNLAANNNSLKGDATYPENGQELMTSQLDVGALMQASKDEGAKRVLSTEKREQRKPLSAGKNSRLLSKLPWDPSGKNTREDIQQDPLDRLNQAASPVSTPIEAENAQYDVSQAIRQRILLRKRKELRKFQNDVPDSTTGSLSDLSPNPLPSDESIKISPTTDYDFLSGPKTFPSKQVARKKSLSQNMRKSYDLEEKTVDQTVSNRFGRVRSTDCLSSPSLELDTPLRVSTNVTSALSCHQSGQQASSNVQSLSNCLNSLRSNDWQQIIHALQSLERMASEPHAIISGSSASKPQGLALSTPHTISSAGSSLKKNPELELLNETVLAIVRECKNLRSQVSKQAIKTLASLFRGLPPRYMDIHCELSIRVLLSKVGEAGVAFLRDEVIQAISCIVGTANPVRTTQALLQHGLENKNANIRKQTAIQVFTAVERLGLNRIFQPSSSNSAKDYSLPSSSYASGTFCLVERLILAVSKFLMDGSLETRLAGRKLLGFLLGHPDCDRNLRKYLTGQAQVTVLEAADQLRKAES